MDALRRVPILLVFAGLAACMGSRPPRPAPGAVVGQIRDASSGADIASAAVSLTSEGADGRAYLATTDAEGRYLLAGLPGGRYRLTAEFAGRSRTVEAIAMAPGTTVGIDLTLDLASEGADPPVGLRSLRVGEITTRQVSDLPAGQARIEGAVSDEGSFERVPGAVVTLVPIGSEAVEQTLTDERGEFRFDGLAPGPYRVAAYYTTTGHGQIEVQRSLELDGGVAAVVPLWIELSR
ncbi:MAG: carboxypeptidase-like regulatory domain-containing protein [Kofleriaceae bacterium]